MKKILIATLLAGSVFSVAGIAAADGLKSEMKPMTDGKAHAADYEKESGLEYLLAKVSKRFSKGWDDDDEHGRTSKHYEDDDDHDDDDDDDDEYGNKQAAAPLKSGPVPDNGLFVPGSKPSVTVQ